MCSLKKEGNYADQQYGEHQPLDQVEQICNLAEIIDLGFHQG